MRARLANLEVTRCVKRRGVGGHFEVGRNPAASYSWSKEAEQGRLRRAKHVPLNLHRTDYGTRGSVALVLTLARSPLPRP